VAAWQSAACRQWPILLPSCIINTRAHGCEAHVQSLCVSAAVQTVSNVVSCMCKSGIPM
jgi:hypothetical protein